MSSIWKHPNSPYWSACFTAFVGQSRQQLKRSVATGDKKLARRIADELDEAGRGLRTPERIKAFLAEIEDKKANRAAYDAFDDVLRLIQGSGLGSKTTRGFTKDWLARTRGEVSPGTLVKYEKTVELLLASLGGKADQDMSLVRRDDISRFRDDQAKRVSAATANTSLKIGRIIFAAAEADGVIQRNEAKFVKKLKVQSEKSARRPFTMPELERILEVCDPEWRSLLLFGFYTGARLGDVAMLTWQNLDLGRNEVRYVSRKTGRTVISPLATLLQKHVEKLPAGDDPKQPLHPKAFEIVTREGRTSTLSRQFREILVQAGLAAKQTHEANPYKKGRSARRDVSEISYHALRHSTVSLLKSAGVSDAVARDLVGHESAEVSRLYTHIEDKAKLDAVNLLPKLTKTRRVSRSKKKKN